MLTGVVRVLSDGTPWRPLVHARDIAAAFAAMPGGARATVVTAVPSTSAPRRNNVTVAEIAQAVADAVPGSTLLITGETGADPRSYRVDFARARAELGFEATVVGRRRRRRTVRGVPARTA